MDSNIILDDNISSSSESSSKFRMAGFGLRFAAIVIDLLLISVVFQTLMYVVILIFSGLAGLFASDASIEEGGEATILAFMLGFGLLSYLLILVASVSYFVFFESSKFQGTPGKMAVGIQVVDVNGNRISWLHALGRNVARILSALPFYIGYLAPLWTKKKQAFHDMAADTYVIRKTVKSVQRIHPNEAPDIVEH